MPKELLLALVLGAVLMLLPIEAVFRKHKIPWWKGIFTTAILTWMGTYATHIWFLVENGNMEGRSYYGAVFLVPIGFVLVALLLRIPYGKLMDACAPAECIMLVIMKVKCMMDGCCGGKVLKVLEDGTQVHFPSQIAEMINALVLLVILLLLALRMKRPGYVYAWYLILYGVTRFGLNHFRADQSVFAFGLAPGAFWSVWAVIIGLVCLIVLTVVYRIRRN